jgi:glutamine synthetase
MTTINAMLAEALDFIANDLEASIAKGIDFNDAVQAVLATIMNQHGAVVFNGNGYSDEWQVEAANRGLLNLRTTIDALPQLITPEAIELFEKYGVFSSREMHSRYEVALEQYVNTIAVEAKITLEMGTTMVLPAAIRYQTELAGNVVALKAAGIDTDITTLKSISKTVSELTAAIASLGAALNADMGHDLMEEARYAQSVLLPAMTQTRTAADTLEGVIADDLWPLPTYQEMLHIL